MYILTKKSGQWWRKLKKYRNKVGATFHSNCKWIRKWPKYKYMYRKRKTFVRSLNKQNKYIWFKSSSSLKQLYSKVNTNNTRRIKVKTTFPYFKEYAFNATYWSTDRSSNFNRNWNTYLIYHRKKEKNIFQKYHLVGVTRARINQNYIGNNKTVQAAHTSFIMRAYRSLRVQLFSAKRTVQETNRTMQETNRLR